MLDQARYNIIIQCILRGRERERGRERTKEREIKEGREING
jgi:hypothetical protein